jgi:AraC-like DNA-binding protein
MDELFFVDRLTMSKPFPLHRHSFAELQLFIGGQGIEIINGISYPLQAGSISLKMPWHVHEIIPHADAPLDIYKCSFRMNNLDEGGLLSGVSGMLAQNHLYEPVAQLDLTATKDAVGLFEKLLLEKNTSLYMKKEMLAAGIIQLAVLFSRNTTLIDGAKPNDQAGVAEEIIHLINLRYREADLCLSVVAVAVHFSEAQVMRLLSEHVGLTFSGLLREIRLRNACSLLQNTTYPVDTISDWVGYRSRSAFYTAFKEDKGISPVEYRKQCSLLGEGTSVSILSNSKMYTQIIYYLHKYYAEELTPDLLAEHFHYNSAYLCKLLSDQGTNFKDLLNETRIYHARQMLLYSNATIPSVGRMVGYSSAETFYRVFKKMVGCTPAIFKQQQNNCHPAEQKHQNLTEGNVYNTF